MIRYIIKRLIQTMIVMICVSLIAFFLVRLAPGNPARMMLPDTATEEQVAAMEKKLGLDKPLIEQYLTYLNGVLHGDLGTSTLYRTPVKDVIMERLPNTAKLVGVTALVAIIIAVPLGILAATHKGKPMDFFAMFFALLGQSMCIVWLAVLCVFIFSVKLGWLPAMGIGKWQNYIMPAITLGYPMAAELTRIARSGMIDTLGEDYITSIRAKGVRRFVVNWKYAFKNATIPVLTLLGISIGSNMAGTIVAETVFGWPGVGQLLQNAIANRDYPLIQSMLLISAAIFALINLVVDIINSLVDPRIVLE